MPKKNFNILKKYLKISNNSQKFPIITKKSIPNFSRNRQARERKKKISKKSTRRRHTRESENDIERHTRLTHPDADSLDECEEKISLVRWNKKQNCA
jgi:hypothetical protein